ncbi:MAG: APC family permease, partial [Candidatus Wallbacteria bacterium]|nr:APC family permease [Candidatus Wallbacteria bacterium]
MKKTMRLSDIVLMNLTAIVGFRWIPVAAAYGASAVVLWFLAALLFFIPLGLVAAELATAWPDQGGLYQWVRRAHGEKPAFLTSWFYWITNLFYYPSLLTFIAVTIAFVIDPALADNKLYVCAVVIGLFWAVTILNLRSMTVGKWLSNLGGTLGTLVPGLIIVVLAPLSVWLWKRPVQTDFSLSAMIPHLSGSNNIAFLSTLMFAMAGMELTPILAGETEDPGRTFPRATVISAVLIAFIYIIGTMAMNMVLAPEAVGAASGIMDASAIIARETGFRTIVPLMAWLMVIGGLGGISVWTVGPIKMLFESTKQGVLPEFFTKLNRYGMPGNAMISQAFLITLIVLFTSLLPTVNTFYSVLVMMTTITYFLPYLL